MQRSTVYLTVQDAWDQTGHAESAGAEAGASSSASESSEASRDALPLGVEAAAGGATGAHDSPDVVAIKDIPPLSDNSSLTSPLLSPAVMESRPSPSPAALKEEIQPFPETSVHALKSSVPTAPPATTKDAAPLSPHPSVMNVEVSFRLKKYVAEWGQVTGCVWGGVAE